VTGDRKWLRLPQTNDFRLRVTLVDVFKLQFGVAGLSGVAVFASRLGPDPIGRTIPTMEFVLLASLLTIIAYSATRPFFSKQTSWLAATVAAGISGSSFMRTKWDQPRDLALLGMCVAISWIIGVGWLERRISAR